MGQLALALSPTGDKESWGFSLLPTVDITLRVMQVPVALPQRRTLRMQMHRAENDVYDGRQ